MSIGHRKLPIIVQSGTNSTAFDVEVQSSRTFDVAVQNTPVSAATSKKSDESDKSVKPDKSVTPPEVWTVIHFLVGFLNSIFHSMEEMAAYKASNGNQLDIDNMAIDIRITAKILKMTAFGVVYRLTEQDGHYKACNMAKKGYHGSFPLNELENYIRATANAKGVTHAFC